MMYYPYLRGRQYDLLALKAFAAESFSQMMPIIEPVRDVAALPQTLAAYNEAKQPIAVILNPQVGHYHLDEAPKHPVAPSLALPYVKPAFILSPLLPPERLLKHPEALLIAPNFEDLKLFHTRQWLPESLTLLVPPEARIRRLLAGRQFGHLTDHLVPEQYLDADTPLLNSFFSDDVAFAQAFKEVGFSDYLTVGKTYSERGYPTKTVTLHLTYLKDNRVWIRHFQSDDGTDFKYVKEKFYQALTKAVRWIDHLDPLNQTATTMTLTTFLAKRHFPGMGVLKQLTLIHHLTIMNRYLALSHQR